MMTASMLSTSMSTTAVPHSGRSSNSTSTSRASTRRTSSSSFTLRPSHPQSFSSTTSHPSRPDDRSSSPSPSPFLPPPSQSKLPLSSPAEFTALSSSSAVPSLPAVMFPIPTADLRGLTREQRELFLYYRQRIESFESQRVDFIARVQALTRLTSSTSSSQSSSVAWQVQDLTWQVANLQQQLSDGRMEVHEERKRALNAASLMHSMRVEALEDRRRIAQLSHLTHHSRGVASGGGHSTQRAPSQFNADQENRLPSASAKAFPSTHPSSSYSRTVIGTRPNLTQPSNERQPRLSQREHSPEDSIPILQRSLESLQSLHAEENAANTQRVDALIADRRQREAEHLEELKAMRSAMQRSRDDYADLQDLFQRTTRDYLQIRHSAQNNERQHLETIASLSQQQQRLQEVNQALQQAMHHTQRGEVHEAMAGSISVGTSTDGSRRRVIRPTPPSMSRPRVRGVVDDRVIEYYAGEMHDLLYHCAGVEREVRELRAALQALKEDGERREREGETEARKWKRKWEREEERRKLDKEGYHVDVKRMRERVRGMEELIIKMDLTRRRDRLREEECGADVGIGSDAQAGWGEEEESGSDVSGFSLDDLYDLQCSQVETAARQMDADLVALTERLAASNR